MTFGKRTTAPMAVTVEDLENDYLRETILAARARAHRIGRTTSQTTWMVAGGIGRELDHLRVQGIRMLAWVGFAVLLGAGGGLYALSQNHQDTLARESAELNATAHNADSVYDRPAKLVSLSMHRRHSRALHKKKKRRA
ncbi:MAG: hypothetical protein ACREGR_01360 [Minisyncoccia bacterium]